MKSNRGYTLIEMLIVVSIVAVVAGIGSQVLINLENFYLGTTARNEIERDARGVLDIIDRFLRQAQQNSIVVDTPSSQGPYSRIQFTFADGRQGSFYQSGSNIFQTISNSSGTVTNSTILSKNVVYIAFTFPRTDDPSILSVSLTMGKNIQEGKRKVLELTVQKVRIMNQ